MRILLVEDETALRTQLADHFGSVGMVVEQAADGNEALYLASEFPYDPAIVDIGLPEITGIELIRRWRNHGLSFPILILTARSNWQDKVEGLEAGADDYLTKPFQFKRGLTPCCGALLVMHKRRHTMGRYRST